jgi:hypothetical protein
MDQRGRGTALGPRAGLVGGGDLTGVAARRARRDHARRRCEDRRPVQRPAVGEGPRRAIQERLGQITRPHALRARQHRPGRLTSAHDRHPRADRRLEQAREHRKVRRRAGGAQIAAARPIKPRERDPGAVGVGPVDPPRREIDGDTDGISHGRAGGVQIAPARPIEIGERDRAALVGPVDPSRRDVDRRSRRSARRRAGGAQIPPPDPSRLANEIPPLALAQ